MSGIRVIPPRSFPDERGYLLEAWRRSELERLGIEAEFRQAIQSCSRRGVVRGLHFQFNPPQGKLIRCIAGRIWDVVVDIRHDSPTLGDHMVLELSATNMVSLWAPAGFAHGFMTLEDDSVVYYLCTAEWTPRGEGAILWNDPALGIAWPDLTPILSAKDREAAPLARWLEDRRSRAFTISARASS